MFSTFFKDKQVSWLGVFFRLEKADAAVVLCDCDTQAKFKVDFSDQPSVLQTLEYGRPLRFEAVIVSQGGGFKSHALKFVRLAPTSAVAAAPAAVITASAAAAAACVVCLDRIRSHIIAPCGHRCLCESCAASGTWSVCPICRQAATAVMRVFD